MREQRALRPMMLRLVWLTAAVVVLGGSAAAQETAPYMTPTAPPESGYGYNVPLPRWLVESSLEHRRAFIEGVAGEAVTLAETDEETGMGLVLASAGELAGVTERIESTIAQIGEIDSAFGIRGISRLVTAEGAVRDTLFGFVVWHESAAGESRKIAREFEDTVDRLLALGQAADRIGGELSSSARAGRRALDKGEYSSIAESAVTINQATANLGTVANEVVAKADELEEIVWEIRESGSTLLDAEWDQVLLATSEARRLAARIVPALEEARTSSLAFGGMATALQEILGTLDMVEDAPRQNGHYAVPWKVFLRDQEVVGDMVQGILEMEGLDEIVTTRVSDLARRIVMADRLLVEYGVYYTGNYVAGVRDDIEARYREDAGYSDNDPQSERLDVLEEVDRRLREDLELQTALFAATSMRTAFASGQAAEGGAIGSERTALSHYKNAWLHALNAGAMVDRAASD
ncbi:MAG: hypothetical protein GF405_00705 [Candidatus Eisenbacteria bacterium]|nr:hypothetical protein [Candidatus Eisenbacteria bacterium]